MLELVTIARPYAIAAFNFSVEHHNLEHWQSMLAFAAEVSRNEHIAKIISGAASPEKIAEVFIAFCGDKLDGPGQNFIRIMAENRRLLALPNVLEHLHLLRAEQESIVKVDIISARSLKKEHLDGISIALQKRLLRKVKLNYKIDRSVLAGIMIRAGDIVIDGSVRGRLERLADLLQS